MKYALIIGNNKYDDPKLAQLKTPAADSQALAKVLADKNIGYFDEVTPLVNKTESEIRRAISGFLTNKKPDDLVLVYFSGHGVLDDRGRLFLSLRDTQTSLLKATAIPSTFISDEMDSCRSKRQILILDCCHSGAFARGTKGDQKAVTEATFEGSGYGRVVMTASDSTQYALEGDQVISQTKLSLFTHFLLEGLKTGEADTDNDGQISLDEWYDYTYDHVISETPNQIPHKWSYNQQGDVIIARNTNVRKRIVELPYELVQAVESPFTSIRESAVGELGKLLHSRDLELANLARLALEKMKGDDSRRISLEAENLLSEYEKAGTSGSIGRGIFPKTITEMEPVTADVLFAGSMESVSTTVGIKPAAKTAESTGDNLNVGGEHHLTSPNLVFNESFWIKWIEIGFLVIVASLILYKYNSSVEVPHEAIVVLFGVLAGLSALFERLVFRGEYGSWWISINTTAGAALGLLHNYLFDNSSWGGEQLGILLAIWVTANLALGPILMRENQGRLNKSSLVHPDSTSASQFMKVGGRQNIFLMLLCISSVLAALFKFLDVFLPGSGSIPLIIYGIAGILLGIFFILRKEIPRNFGFITLVSFLFLDGIQVELYPFFSDYPLNLFTLSGIIALASGTFFISQRETLKNLGFIMLSGSLISISLAYFSITNEPIFIPFSIISGFFSFLAAVFLFLGK